VAVRVVTDSTADLPPDLAREWGIEVIPLFVHFGTEVYRDGLDMGPNEFYQRLVRSPRLPTTSAPPPGAFQEVYARLLEGAEGVVSVHISSKLSATHDSALLAGQQFKGKIEVIDSLSCSMGVGLLALAAAERARGRKKLKEIAQEVRALVPRAHLFGLVDTLDYLVKGGRVGKAQAFLGSLLQVKPLLTIKHGEAHPLERVRTRRRALERLVELAASFSSASALAVLSSTTPQEAEALAGRLGKGFACPIYQARFGPVMGTYVGPGALGVALIGEARP